MSHPAKPAVAARHAQAPGRVRIIGGQWKRTPIALPAVPGLRPTPDRVRETVFNWLAHLRPDLFADDSRAGDRRPREAAATLPPQSSPSRPGAAAPLQRREAARRETPLPPPATQGRAFRPPPPAGEGRGGGTSLRASTALDLFAGSGALGFEAASRGVARVTLVEREHRALAALRALRDKLHAENVEILAGDALAVAARLPVASFDLVFLDPPFDGGLLAPALAAGVRLLTPGGLIYAESGAPLAAGDFAPLGLRLLRNDRAGQVYVHLLVRHEA